MTAKEMFEELGYTYNIGINYISYKRGDSRIYFLLDFQTYEADYFINSMRVEMDELKAIYKQCEELGWL